MNRIADVLLETPFLDAELFDRLGGADEARFDFQLPSGAPATVTFPSGQTLAVVTGPSLAGQEYFDPNAAANPLLDVSGTRARTKLSTSFTAGEFARSGSTRFAKARIDPALVECLEALRAFLKTPVTILDGYYSWKYLVDLAQRQGLAQPPATPHLSGQGAKFKAGGLSGLELAKAVVFACAKDTSVAIGETTAAVYVKQAAPQVTSYIKAGEPRERAIHAIRQYRELFGSDAGTTVDSSQTLEGIGVFVHAGVHRHQIRDENILADVAFHRSYFVKHTRQAKGITGRYDRTKPTDVDLRKRILEKLVRPALKDVVVPAARGGGVPTTPKGERVAATPAPDVVPVNLTGRFETVHKDQSEELGKTMVINQAGTHIEVVISPVNSPDARPDVARFQNRYYGDLEAGGSFRLFSRERSVGTIRLVPEGATIVFEWESAGKKSGERYTRVNDHPVLLERSMSAFDAGDRALLEAYEWRPLLKSQIAYLRQLFEKEDPIAKYLKAFYEAEGDLQRWQEFYQGKAVENFGSIMLKWLKDPKRGFHRSDRTLALFYIRSLLTYNRWRPSSSYPYLSVLDWAQRAVSVVEYQCKHHPNRTGTVDAGDRIDDLVEAFGLKKGTDSGGHIHTYRLTMKLGGVVAGGGLLGGTVTVEKTDAKTWPGGSETFRIGFAAVGAGLKWKKGKGARALGPLKAGDTYVGEASSNFYWLPQDFPGQVRVALGEASASAGVKVGGEAGFMHILGRGGLPTLQVIFGDVDAKAGKGKQVGVAAELLAGIGKLFDKSFKDVQYPPMPDKTDYAVQYKLNTSSHFGFNSAVLTKEARQAVRVMCAHELVALMSPESRLAIDAYTDPVGTDPRNQELSLLRAGAALQAVKDILGTKLACTVTSASHGETKSTGQVRDQDQRRVDFTLDGRLVLRLTA